MRYVLPLLLSLCVYEACAQAVAAELFSRKLYMQTNVSDLEVRTLMTADTAGKVVYKVTNVSAITAAIMAEAGYTLFVKSQCRWFLSQTGETRGGTMSSVFVSDHLMERLGEPNVKQDRDDIKVSLSFVSGGTSEYAGREPLDKSTAAILCSPNDLVLRIHANFDVGQAVRRAVSQVYLLLPPDTKVNTVVDLIEKEMDKLKLGIDYGFPKFAKTAVIQ